MICFQGSDFVNIFKVAFRHSFETKCEIGTANWILENGSCGPAFSNFMADIYFHSAGEKFIRQGYVHKQKVRNCISVSE